MVLGEGSPLLVVLEESDRRRCLPLPTLPTRPLLLDPMADGGNSRVSDSFKFPFTFDSFFFFEKIEILGGIFLAGIQKLERVLLLQEIGFN